MARYAYVNGRYVEHREASVHIEDRGYQLADGVYEVVGVRDGKLIDETPHIDRLDRSLRELRIAWPVSRATLGFIMRELMRRNRLRDGLVYMQVTRGVARRDHAFPTTPVKPALVLTTKNTKRAEADAGPGVAVKSQPDIRWGRCDIKTVALLPNVLAKQAARESGAYEAWLVDGEGRVTEGASTNAWIVTQDGELVTRADRQRHPGRHHAPHAEVARRCDCSSSSSSGRSRWPKPRRPRRPSSPAPPRSSRRW